MISIFQALLCLLLYPSVYLSSPSLSPSDRPPYVYLEVKIAFLDFTLRVECLISCASAHLKTEMIKVIISKVKLIYKTLRIRKLSFIPDVKMNEVAQILEQIFASFYFQC